MSTLSGFNRISDPIVAVDLAAKILSDTSRAVSVEITPTDILVTGDISESDRTVIQNSMNGYFYAGLEYGVGLYADDDPTMAANAGDRVPTQRALKSHVATGMATKIDTSAMSDDFPMSADSTKVVTENVVLQGDLATRRKAYVSGVLKNDSFIYSSKATTNGSGVVTFYITSDGTAQGAAVFNNVYADSISVAVYGSTANYQPYSPSVSGDNKSVTVTINQATTVLVGLIQLVSASSGIDCRLYVMGD